ncbi:hypothetical protein [Paraflavitalea speifideaquila]|uniref:hypothetical protein n=1 Tax=Paraflavitalea speifideaquila TaxID=3076558 RepID=UPI0028EFA515|nr:hypothetical protein [Paraflavitalea speifideiaquila]
MRKIVFVAAGLFTAAVFYFSCQDPATKPGDQEKDNVAGTKFDFKIYFDSARAPYSLEKGSDSVALISFAWNEFLALHWRSGYGNSAGRDMPDRSWNYNTPGKYPDLAVWETYAHRSELRPFDDNLQEFNVGPHYSMGSGYEPKPGSNASFKLWNNLDENNEIGSCYLYGRTDAFPNKSNLVLYQAKCNYDEYNYLLTYANKKRSYTKRKRGW